MSDVYRQAASMLVLRPVSVCKPGGECETIYQMLLLHKPRKNDSWQLPQGGMEPGEELSQTAARELMEEAGITTAEVLGTSEKFYQYDFPTSYRRFRRDEVCGQRIGFVFARVPEQTTVTVDENEVDSYAWIDIGQLGTYVKRPEYRTLVEELYEEAVEKLR